MPVSAEDILNCAVELTKNTRGVEVVARAAIARSYYAAFHDCLAWHENLPAQGSLPSGFNERGTHVELAAQLLNPDGRLSKEDQDFSKKRGIGLRNLHADRVVADYKLRRTVTSLDARNALAAARQIVAVGAHAS